LLDKSIKQNVVEELLPELNNLVEHLPQYGEICLRVKICNFKVGTISTAKEISKRVQKSKEEE